MRRAPEAFEARRVIAMSKGKWPTPAVLKRAIEAVQRSGLTVSGVRVSDDAVFVETRQTAPLPRDEGRPNSFDQVLGGK